jgi:cation diffusion facilitator family transporter
VNLVAALAAFWALTLAAKPADRSHPYGHFKAEYFSSGLESVLIVVAALAIIHAAIGHLLQPQPLEQLGIGLVLSLLATALNGLVAWLLLKASRRFHSITLRADAHHLLSDVWTSLGVVVGIGLVKVTGWAVLDPLIAIAVAINIIVTGWKLFHETASGLLDRSLPEEEQRRLEQLLAGRQTDEIRFHALRTRVAGSQRFVSLHVLVPGHWSVQQGHDLCEQLEEAMRRDALIPAGGHGPARTELEISLTAGQSFAVLQSLAGQKSSMLSTLLRQWTRLTGEKLADEPA